MNKKGFTLIELLAVIIILGILMIIAIPSVTSYINNSRKSAYVDSAREIIAGARNFVNEGKVPMYDTSATYYINASCISTENGQKSPYGDFVDEETYVIVTYDGEGYDYYWVSRDTTGQGVPTPTKITDLDEDDIQSDIALGTIIPTKISDDKSNIQVINSSCNGFEEAAEGGSGGTTPTNTAASTILAKYKEDSQLKADAPLNQIPDTNIYIFKGGTTNPPANYVKFNCSNSSDTSTCEDWRIIGIYNGQMKIQRVATIARQYYDNTLSFSNVWADSDIKTYLNTTYYNTLGGTAKSMIDAGAEWNVGASENNAIASDAYTSETGTKWKGTDTSDPGVGLMASYEFLYATGGGQTCLTTAGNIYSGSCGIVANNWMKPGSNSWTLSGRSGDSLYSLYVYSDGNVLSNSVYNTSAVAPAVFLKSDVTITDGDGTDPEHAYILHYEES